MLQKNPQSALFAVSKLWETESKYIGAINQIMERNNVNLHAINPMTMGYLEMKPSTKKNRKQEEIISRLISGQFLLPRINFLVFAISKH
jgi:hypothetical protein